MAQKPAEAVMPYTEQAPLLQFLGDLAHRGNAKRIYTSVLIGGCVNVHALLDTGSEISLICAKTFAEVTMAMLALGKTIQVEPGDMSLVSFTQGRAPLTKRAWLDIPFQEMTPTHPVHVRTFDTGNLLIGRDLLGRLAPLIDCLRGHIWAQVTSPYPVNHREDNQTANDQVAWIQELETPAQVTASPPESASHSGDQCNHDPESCESSVTPFTSPPSDPCPFPTHESFKAIGVCALCIQIGKVSHTHFMTVVPQRDVPFLIGVDILVRLGAQLDTVNQVRWSQADIDSEPMVSGQTIPQTCQTASEFDLVIPARSAGTPVRLMILKGQKLHSTCAFFPPLPYFWELKPD